MRVKTSWYHCVAAITLLITPITWAAAPVKYSKATTDKPEELNWNVVWTVRMDSKEALVLLRITSGHMVNLAPEDIDWKNRIINRGSVTLEWHYPSGEPWYAWIGSKLPDKSTSPMSEAARPYWENEISVWAGVTGLGPNMDNAAIDKKVYFLDDLRSTNPALRPTDLGLVWKGTVRKYKALETEYYVILNRELNDASLIRCDGDTVFY